MILKIIVFINTYSKGGLNSHDKYFNKFMEMDGTVLFNKG